MSGWASGLDARYSYDAQGRRRGKTLAGGKTIYVTDADNREVLEYDGTTGAVRNWYAYGLGSNAPLNQMNVAAGTRQTLIPDSLGSIVAALDSGTGAAFSAAGYSPYGENAAVTTGSFRYTAQRHDGETAGSASQPSGLYYYRARMYSPALGRFLQTDPAGPAGSAVNLYAYVDNDPLNLTDPDGHCYPACTIIAGAAIGGVAGGGYYLYSTPHPTLAGFLASTGEGAVVGGYAGTGAGLLEIGAVGGGAHVVSQFVNSASSNNLGRYGNTISSNALTVAEDFGVGAVFSAGGAKVGRFAAPVVESLANDFGAIVFTNPTVNANAAAFVLKNLDKAGSAADFMIDVLSNIGTDALPNALPSTSSGSNPQKK
ncbi:MAG: RHS repeat-associated core domain-containing protein [Rhizomicrobium sp.]